MEKQMKLLFKMLMGVGLVLLFSGCASTSGPTTNVGIVNGKYAARTTIPNNNKGKKVKITAGQSYNCEMTGSVDGKIYSFDLKVSNDGNTLLSYNDKVNGKLSPTSYTGKFVFKPKYGWAETTKGSGVFRTSPQHPSKIFLAMNKKQAKANQGYVFQCTQTTNNTITHTRYMTNHEIDAYKHGQQIAVQQRAIDSANYNATMANIQAQNAQMNYNTQQMMNRNNTYKVKIY